MRRLGLLLLTVLAGPVHSQSGGQAGASLTCVALKAATSQTSSHYQWTVSGPSGNTTETGSLRSAPHFECVDDAILVVEFTSTAGYSFFAAYFSDGSDIAYGGQQIARRGKRFVLPVQAKARIAPQFRGAFDYHCKLDMPADPITPDMRRDCTF